MSGSAKRSQRHVDRRFLRRFVSTTLLFAFALTWWTLLRPSTLGGPLTVVTVTGQSMEPGLHTGDLAIVLRRDSYAVGDVVAFRTEGPDAGYYVIHRLMSGSNEAGFVTRGDNNSYDDPWTPRGDEIAGRMVASFPGLSTKIGPLLDPVAVSALLAAATVFFVVLAPASTSRPPRHRAAGETTCDSVAEEESLV